MKRDMDLVREILFQIEASPHPLDVPTLKIKTHPKETVYYHVMLMHEAGLIDAMDSSGVDEICWYPKDLTWEGHDFLEAIRDPARWEKAKKILSNLEGGWVFPVVKRVLNNLIEEELARHGKR